MMNWTIFNRRIGKRTLKPRTHRAFVNLNVEALEDRCLLNTSFVYTGNAKDGKWENTQNWLVGGMEPTVYPGQVAKDDSVTIDSARIKNNTPIVLSKSVALLDLYLISSPKITLNGNLEVAGTFDFRNAFKGSAGSIGGAGTLTLDKTGYWAAGTMFGAGETIIQANCTFKIESSFTQPVFLDHRTLANRGNVNWVNGNIKTDHATITNQADSKAKNPPLPVFLCTANGTISDTSKASGGAVSNSTFNNYGMVANGSNQFDGPANDAIFGIVFNNYKSVEVQTGSLNIAAGGTSIGGYFGLSVKTVLRFETGGSINKWDFVTFVGQGSVVLFANAVIAHVVHVNAPFFFEAGEMSGGLIVFQDQFTWEVGAELVTGGTMLLLGQSSFIKDAGTGADKTLKMENWTIANAGVLTMELTQN